MLDDKKIQELKSLHGDLVAVSAKGGNPLIFKRPARADFDRWHDYTGDSKTDAARVLAQSCLVHPDRDGMMVELEKFPGLLVCRDGILDTIVALAGFKAEDTIVKKL
jgi:hypothetical protein